MELDIQMCVSQKNATWKQLVELRVLRTISRYWIAKINIRTAEVSIISQQQQQQQQQRALFLSLLFFRWFLLVRFSPLHSSERKVAQRFCVYVSNVDTTRAMFRPCVFLTLSSLFPFDSFVPLYKAETSSSSCVTANGTTQDIETEAKDLSKPRNMRWITKKTSKQHIKEIHTQRASNIDKVGQNELRCSNSCEWMLRKMICSFRFGSSLSLSSSHCRITASSSRTTEPNGCFDPNDFSSQGKQLTVA